MRIISSVLFLLLSTSAFATVHTCKVDSRTVFSDIPCDQLAKPSHFQVKQQKTKNKAWWEEELLTNDYKGKVDIDGPLDTRVSKIAEIINLAWIKSKQCEAALEQGDGGAACQDVNQYLELGTIFWQAGKQFQKLDSSVRQQLADKEVIPRIESQISELLDFRLMLTDYVRQRELE